jgi:hypothetical protein
VAEAADPALLRRQIGLIRRAVAGFGSAHDARDRGYEEAAERLDAEGNEMIRAAFDNAPGLRPLLPETWARVARGDDVADCGFEINREIAAALAGIDDDPPLSRRPE